MIIGYKIPTHTPCKSTLDAWLGGKVQQEIFKRAYDTFNMRFLNSVKSFWLGEGGGLFCGFVTIKNGNANNVKYLHF